MMKEIEAIYERGVLRPVEPLELPEGSRLDVILVSRDEVNQNGVAAANSLSEIAELPLEGVSEVFSGRDHDSLLYPQNPKA
jgi:predicted DNA-binding antitoxin AbrB/MazE fold protein